MQAGRARHGIVDARRLSDLAGADRGRLVLASLLSASASVLWIPQAFVLARAVDGLLTQVAETANITTPALVFALLAAVRIALDALSGHIASRASERVQLRTRARLLDAVACSSPFDARRAHSGEIAAVLTHHVDALAPYLRRYEPARMRVAIVPVSILLATLPISWAAAVILCTTGPLISCLHGAHRPARPRGQRTPAGRDRHDEQLSARPAAGSDHAAHLRWRRASGGGSAGRHHRHPPQHDGRPQACVPVVRRFGTLLSAWASRSSPSTSASICLGISAPARTGRR